MVEHLITFLSSRVTIAWQGYRKHLLLTAIVSIMVYTIIYNNTL